jgi:hypothetical protein
MASLVYWLQVGVYLHEAGKSGEITYWYTKTGNMAILRIIVFKAVMFQE